MGYRSLPPSPSNYKLKFGNASKWLGVLTQPSIAKLSFKIYIENLLLGILPFFIVVLFLGNKKDLENQREVPYSSAQMFAQEYDMLNYLETSAKENSNIDEAFQTLAKVSNGALSGNRIYKIS